MDITKSLIEKSNGLLIPQAETTDDRYSCFDDGAVEVEVGEFLYGMIRVTKPLNILTTGIYTGVSDLYIAQANKDNANTNGMYDALEIDSTHIERAKKLWRNCGVHPYILAWQVDSLKFRTHISYDFMFLDSEPNIRLHEVVNFYDNLTPGGYVFIHDMPYSLCQGNKNPDHPDIKHWPIGEIPSKLIQLIKDGSLKQMFFPNPRGMMGLYKPRLDEYVF